MRTAEEMLDEIESADDGVGPAPAATVDDPVLARIVVDKAVMAARDAGLSWQAIGGVLGMTRQGANKRFHAA